MNPVHRYFAALQQLAAAARHYDTSLWHQVRRLRRLKSVYRFRLHEALPWGLTDPAIPDAELDRYPSRIVLKRLKARVNDPAGRADTSDKARFYRLCGEHGLPVPEWLGVYPGRAANPPADPQVRRIGVDDVPDGRFVAKPAWGEQGKGLLFFDRAGERFRLDGAELDPEAFRTRFAAAIGARDYVVQRRLVPHPALAAISGGEGVQCARIVTFIDRDARVHLVYARFKFTSGDNLVDNFQLGVSGNVVGEVDLDSGIVVKALAKASGTPVLQRVTHHPATGADLRVALPHWPEAIALAKRAALAFPRQRSLGWDIALTADGVRLVEGNRDWSPMPMGPCRKPDPPDEWDALLRGREERRR